ncbi:MAG: hypothetical protein G8D27_01825 [Buchnera aphidicola (Periphyllus aceris)]|nr:hypothetical protein [Buchnera aphidicola (Periphyllus aceris)]
MIKIYTSNDFNYLIKKICHIMNKKSFKNVFIKEIIIIPDIEISKFIKKIINKIFGIFCNISFFTIEKFIFYILELFIYKKKYKRFNKKFILWELMNLSESFQKKNIFKKKENEYTKLKYFNNISKFFFQYLIYRKKILKNWEKNKKKYKKKILLKQKKIWKKIIKKNNFHYLNLKKNFIKKYKIKKKYKNLPPRIFIINPINYPISYIKILKKISYNIDIYFFICIPFNNNILKKNNFSKNANILYWTKNYINKINYILSLTKKKKDKYFNNKKKTLLNIIKNKIFNYKNNNFFLKKKIKNDNSISIHECQNRLREIEILHDNILNVLNKNKNLKPKNIIVKTKNIQKYIPYINSVFKSEIKKNNIPYLIYEKIFDKNNPILYMFNKILSLQKNKFKSTKILNFLNFNFIAKKFSIKTKEIKTIKKWIIDTNICWGINKKHKKKINFPEINQNTWKYGIRKIIFGYGIYSKDKQWKNIFPYNIHEKKDIEILEKLIFFIKILKKWKKKLSTKKTCKTWKKIYKNLINDFFYKNKKTKIYLKYIKKKWNSLLKEISDSSYQKKISIKIIKYIINKRIKKIYFKKKYNNNIIFTNFNVLKTIPFKITYILGMNNNFPKNYISNQENLINLYKEKMDLKKNKEDYLNFLELIGFTKEKIFISYIYNSYENFTNKYSFLLRYLIKFIKKNVYFKKNKLLFIHTPNDFYKENFYLKKNFNSFHSTWNLSKKKNFIKKNFIKKKLKFKKNKKIESIKLIKFWKNPINYFFHNTLKIYFKKINLIHKNHEPFYINSKYNYLINIKILNYLVFKKNVKKLFIKIKSIGILPYNHLGKIYFNEQIKKNKNILKKINKLKVSLKEITIKMKIKNFKIYGKIKNVSSKNGILRWKPFNLNYYDKLSLWLEHILYCSNGGKHKSTYIGLNNKIIFKNIKKKKAKKYLLKYIFGYIQGLTNPIPLIQTGITWFHYIYNRKKNKISKNKEIIQYSEKKMLEIWNGNKYFMGEKNNLYIKKIFKSLNKKSIKKILRITKYWIKPMYKNIL